MNDKNQNLFDHFNNKFPPNKFEEDFLEIFRKDLKSTYKSRELYAALCNVDWHNEELGIDYSCSWRSAGGLIADLRNSLKLRKRSPEVCEHCGKKKDKHRKVIRIITMHLLFSKDDPDRHYEITNHYCYKSNHSRKFCAGYLGMEDYIDFYCVGGEGEVKPWIKKKLNSRGWEYFTM